MTIMPCVYCKKESEIKGVEHVVPQSFGTFGTKTPTLDRVCDSCNAFFGKELDQPLARDSWEGLTRYRQGIRSSEKRNHSRIKLALGDDAVFGDFAGALLESVDGTKGGLPPPRPQFRIYNNKTKSHDAFPIEEIKNFKMDDGLYGAKGTRKVQIISHIDQRQAVIDELKKVGVDYVHKSDFYPDFAKDGNSVPVDATVSVDHVIKRAYLKIILNAFVWRSGADAFAAPAWEHARNYVRFNGEPLKARMSNKPFWGEEGETMRFEGDHISVMVENREGNVIGKIQFYDHYLYEFILMEGASIPEEQEFAVRFTRDEEPAMGEKRFIRNK